MNDSLQPIVDGFLNGGAIPTPEEGVQAVQEVAANPHVQQGLQAVAQAASPQPEAEPVVEEEVETQAEVVEPNPHEDFYLLIGKHAESDHGDEPIRTHDAREKGLPEEERTYDIGYGHKIKDDEWTSGMIHGIPFVDGEGNYLALTEEQKQEILTADMKAESDLARKVWDKKLKAQGSSWDKLDIRYRYALTSLAYNVGGSKAGSQWNAVIPAAINRDVKEFAKQLRRQDNKKYTAGMDNRVLKELFYAMLIRNASEVSDVLPLADAKQAGVPL